MFNRCCFSVRLKISIQRNALLYMQRSFATSDGDSTSLRSESLQRSKASGKIISEVKKSRNVTPKEMSHKNIKPENIRRKLLEFKQKKEGRKPKPNEVASEEVLAAVNSVAKSLHQSGIADEQKTRNELIEKLMEYEREKFEAATGAQYSELLTDRAFTTFLESLKDETTRCPPGAVVKRQMRQGLLLLKREIFYQALQSGHKAEDARGIAERAMKIAEERALGKHEIQMQNDTEEQEKNVLKEKEQAEKESAFYNIALQLASKMLDFNDPSVDECHIDLTDQSHIAFSNVIHPDCRVENIFTCSGNKLDIFKVADIPKLKDHSVKQWWEWDKSAAAIWNSSFGPTNAFEEMIELTEEGKMWPYPIDNEYQIGEEEEVGFYDHIFLYKYLDQYNLPEEGPVAEFMELVCIGLSKNPYMSVKKKHAHLDWFVNYFKEKAEEIKRIQTSAGLLVEGSI